MANPFGFDFGIKDYVDAVFRPAMAVPGFGVSIAAWGAAAVAASTALARRRILEQEGDALRDAILLAWRAPAYLARWRAWLNDGLQAEVHDIAVDREATRLLEALQSAPLPKQVIQFLDELVHDSMAGFIGFGMAEFQVNGYGIAKFRRIFFGNNGDRLLRTETARLNKERIAAADQRRKNRDQWDREASEHRRMNG